MIFVSEGSEKRSDNAAGAGGGEDAGGCDFDTNLVSGGEGMGERGMREAPEVAGGDTGGGTAETTRENRYFTTKINK